MNELRNVPLDSPFANEAPSLDFAGLDLIGDIHGRIDKLTALLIALGYEEWADDRVWRHPAGRKAVFVGDLIDRGDGQLEVLGLVRRMVEAGAAHCVMGNHEWHAIGVATKVGGRRLRELSASRARTHEAFLNAVGLDSPLHAEVIEWLKTLPPMLELNGARICHAWWSEEHIPLIRAGCNADGSLREDFLLESFSRRSEARRALDAVLCGIEATLPDGATFLCHSGKARSEARLRWWAPEADTYRKSAIVDGEYVEQIPDVPLPDHLRFAPVTMPTFVGHYWESGVPRVQNGKVAVLDFSAAKGGPLVAYRWDGEAELGNSKLVWVNVN